MYTINLLLTTKFRRLLNFLLGGLLILLLVPLPAYSGSKDIINYSSKIFVFDEPFTGTGYFKFAIVAKDNVGDVTDTLWNNDGTNESDIEPFLDIEVEVVDGNYSTSFGDPDLGYVAISPLIFDTAKDLHLRVWFDDGVNGPELLSPDIRIGSSIMANNALLFAGRPPPRLSFS